jgi:hypothetical protein
VAGVACLLFFLSLWGAWNASRQTEYPPIHDVLSYTTKAENVWAELRQGKFTGLLGVEQTIRPFGTSLLGYPFGYDNDFRAFYWRTVAFPACFAALGAFFAALAAGASWKSPSAWLLACLAGMLPMWWAFDPIGWRSIIVRPVSHWGMMDGMQGGLAALATGLLLLGWRRNSALAAFAGIFLSGATLLIKPVGVFLIAGHTIAAGCLWAWSCRKEEGSDFRRFAAGSLTGIAWCVLIGVWCYFSPYFSQANQEMGRQALDQLKQMGGVPLWRRMASHILPSLGVYALGFISISFWVAAACHFKTTLRDFPWTRIVAVVGGLVLALQLAVLYGGTHFLTPRYFIPSLATFWIFVSPFVWLLLRNSLLARLGIVANAFILAASVWLPDLARLIHQGTGYPTFSNLTALDTAVVARSAIENAPQFDSEPIVYVLQNDHLLHLTAHQLSAAGGWKEQVCWKYGPRVWEKHSPAIHPHEIALADFLVISSGEGEFPSSKAIKKALRVLDSPDGLSATPALSGNENFTVRKIADPTGLEKLLVEKLAGEGMLNSWETGPVRETTPQGKPLAAFQSGDELIYAQAEWVEGKLRITSTWSGTRVQKGHLAMNVAFCDADGTEFHWITCSLLPPPKSPTGPRYQRTIVDELDCGSFGGRIRSVSLGIYDRYNKAMIPLATPGGDGGAERVSIPLSGILEPSTP